MQKRYDAIDGLRTIAAFGIVLMHVLENGNYAVDGFVFNKFIPSFTNFVFLFMTVSAFGMCCGYYEKIIHNQVSLVDFYGKRFAKIWPFFTVLVVLDVIILPSVSALYEAFADLSLLFGFLPGAGNITVIGVGWFIGLIFVFYLIFPFFCYLIEDRRRAWISFGISLIYNFVCSNYFEVGRSNILYSGCFFLAGGLVYLYRDEIQRMATKFRRAVLTGIVGMLVVYYAVSGAVPIMLMLSGLMLAYALREMRGYSLLQNPFTKFISGISMEIYLSHMVMFRVIEKLQLMHLLGNGWLSYIITAIGTIVAAVMFSVACKQIIVFIESKVTEIKIIRAENK